MATQPTFALNYPAASTTLAAGVATAIDIPAAGANRITITLKNTGGSNAVTALTIATIPLSVPGAARSVSTGIPLSAGTSLTINIVDEPCSTVRLTATSTSGTTVSVEAVGQ